MGGSRAAGRRIVPFAAALTLHAALLGVYLATRPPGPVRADPPTVQVWLTRPPAAGREPERERRRQAAPTAAPGAPALQAPAPVEIAPPEAAPTIEPQWRVAPPGPGDPVDFGAGRPLLRRCLDATTDEALREACETMWARGRPRGEPPLGLASRSAEQAGGYARTVRKKEAFRAYRQTGDLRDYPGLRCAFGRDCEPKGRSPP